jgi:gliding motility-associated-like protein
LYKSPPICGQARSDRPPDPVTQLTATVSDSGIVINGIGSSLAKTYEVYRKDMNQESYSLEFEADKLPLLDTSADFMNKSFCYKLSFKDICGNQAIMSDSICPIWLRLDLPTDSEKSFTWTDLLGWKGGVEKYELIRTSEKNDPEITEAGLSNSKNIKGRDPINQKLTYQIRAFAKNPDLYPEPSFSNPVFVTQKLKFRFPDVFTPNEDAFNGTFKCYSLFIKEFELKIFNAWGNAIFYTDKVETGWDGKIDSKPAASGPYAYWAKGVDSEGNKVETRGYFTLLR